MSNDMINTKINPFNMGDRVMIASDYIDEYENSIDRDWVDDAYKLFRRGRVFTITKIVSVYEVEIDYGEGGAWKPHNLEPRIKPVVLDEDLFTV